MNKMEIGNIVSQMNFVLCENEVVKKEEILDILEELVVDNLSMTDTKLFAERLSNLPSSKWTY